MKEIIEYTSKLVPKNKDLRMLKQLFAYADNYQWNEFKITPDMYSTLVIQIKYKYLEHDMIYMKLDEENLKQI